MKNVKSIRAFTLIELLLYTGIFAITAGLLTGILVTTTRIETKESASIEVTNQTQSVLERIQGLVRDSSLIEKVYEGENEAANLPCQTFCALKLRMEDPTLDPTFILSDQNGVYIKRTNIGEKVLLTSSRVKTNNLLFTKYDNPGGHSTVNVDLTLTYNSEDPTLNQISQRLTSAIGRVSAASFDFDLLPDQANLRNIGQTNLQWKDLALSGSVYLDNSRSLSFKDASGTYRSILGYSTANNLQIFNPASTGSVQIGINNSANTGSIRFYTLDSQERVIINSTGNVGIGTSSPVAKLDVRGALIIPAGFGNTAPRPAVGVPRLQGEIAGVGGGTPTLAYDDGFLRISAGGGTNATAKSFIDISGYSTLADMNKNIVLGTSGVERVRIDLAGNVGVGTATPAEKLEVVGNIKLSGATPTYKVTNIAGPSALSDAATKEYVDVQSAGGVPPGAGILSASSTSLSGYTYTGSYFTAEPAAFTWTAKTAMPTGRYGLAAAAVNNKIYAIGGYTTTYGAVNEEYNPATNSWLTKAAMPTARYFLAAAAVNNKIYAIGGNGSSTYLATNEEYDPVANTWATKTAMPTARHYLAAAAVNNKIYAIGGYNGSYLATNEEYDPATNTWATKTVMPTARYNLATAVVNNKIYAIGGANTAKVAVNQEYDPVANTWATKTAMPTARDALAVAVVNNKIYAIGGYATAASAVNEEYDPATNTWATKTVMPTARNYLAAAAVNNKIYAIGGNSGGALATNEECTVPRVWYIHTKN